MSGDVPLQGLQTAAAACDRRRHEQIKALPGLHWHWQRQGFWLVLVGRVMATHGFALHSALGTVSGVVSHNYNHRRLEGHDSPEPARFLQEDPLTVAPTPSLSFTPTPVAIFPTKQSTTAAPTVRATSAPTAVSSTAPPETKAPTAAATVAATSATSAPVSGSGSTVPTLAPTPTPTVAPTTGAQPEPAAVPNPPTMTIAPETSSPSSFPAPTLVPGAGGSPGTPTGSTPQPSGTAMPTPPPTAPNTTARSTEPADVVYRSRDILDAKTVGIAVGTTIAGCVICFALAALLVYQRGKRRALGHHAMHSQGGGKSVSSHPALSSISSSWNFNTAHTQAQPTGTRGTASTVLAGGPPLLRTGSEFSELMAGSAGHSRYASSTSSYWMNGRSQASSAYGHSQAHSYGYSHAPSYGHSQPPSTYGNSQPPSVAGDSERSVPRSGRSGSGHLPPAPQYLAPMPPAYQSSASSFQYGSDWI